MNLREPSKLVLNLYYAAIYIFTKQSVSHTAVFTEIALK